MNIASYNRAKWGFLRYTLSSLALLGITFSQSTLAQESEPVELTIGVPDTGAWGNNYRLSTGPDVQEQTFTFDYTPFTGSGGLLLAFAGFDAEKSNVEDAELSINVDGGVYTVLAPSTRNGQTRTMRIELPDSAFASGTRHTVQVFNNEGPNETWGMRRVSLKPLRGERLAASYDQVLPGRYGYRYGASAHPAVIAIDVDVPSAQNLKLEVNGYDINRFGEVQVLLNGRVVGYLRSGGRRRLSATTTINIPAVTSGTNTFEFRQFNVGARWGITGFKVSEATARVVANCDQTESTVSTANKVLVRRGNDLNEVVNASPPGSEFLISRGVYVLDGPIVPRTGDKFICEAGTKIRGTVRLNSRAAVPAGAGVWRIPRSPAIQSGSGVMRPGNEVNVIPNDVFVDGKLYLRVDSIRKVSDVDRRLDGTTVYYGTFYQRGRDVYLPMDPRRRIVEMSRVPYAFQSVDAGGDDNVTIERCAIERFATGDMQGAIEAGEASNWTLRRVSARYNHTGGLHVGDNTRAYCGNYSFNGQNGISGTFTPATDGDGNTTGFQSRSSNAVVQNTTISYNNWAGYDAQWHSGGMKFVGTNGLTVTDNKIHHNYGVGYWIDFEVENSVFRNNEVYDNAARGIQVEVSRGAVIEDNSVRCNSTIGGYSLGRSWFWGSNILAKNSSNVSITNNEVVVDHGQAIAVVDNLFTGYFIGTFDFRRASNVSVTDNTISFTRRAVPGGNARFTHQMMGLESDGTATTGGLGALDCTPPDDFLAQGLVTQSSIGACNAIGGIDATNANNEIRDNTYRIPRGSYTYWRKSGTSVDRNDIPVSGTFSPADIEIDNTLDASICN